MSRPFEGTAAVVTGSSSGIGRAIAIALARGGVEQVGVHCRKNTSGAEQTAAEIRAIGGRPFVIKADLASPQDCDRLVEQAFDQLGSIATWVNNAGADVLTGEFAKQHFDEKLRRLMEVDVMGTIRLSRLVADQMISQTSAQPPSLVFLGWDQASFGMEGDAGQMFAPVKAAVTSFAKSLAQSLAPAVRVNTIAPGWIQTAWGETTSGYWSQRAIGQSLMGRWGSPEDVARAVCFVSDPANSFVTGQTIEVNGGWNRRYDTNVPSS